MQELKAEMRDMAKRAVKMMEETDRSNSPKPDHGFS